MTDQWIASVEPLAGVLLGAAVTYFFTARSRRDESIMRFREEKYASLLVKMQGFVGATVSGELKRAFFVEQYQSWLYASDDVIRAINNMVDFVKGTYDGSVKPDATLGHKLVGDVVLAMRKDLLRRTSLTDKAFEYTDVHEDN